MFPEILSTPILRIKRAKVVQLYMTTDRFRQADAHVEDEMVFVGRDIVTAALQTAPASIRLRAANRKRALTYENGAMLFMAGAGCPNATDINRGRSPGKTGPG